MLRELTIPLTDDFNDGVLHANASEGRVIVKRVSGPNMKILT